MERSLQEEARVAGVFSHRSTIGAAREFLVNRILRSILPSTIKVGHGQILDASDSLSPEIDVVVYDARFPLIRVSDTSSVFLAESVVATIEVKSVLDRASLKDALDHVASCAPRIILADPDDFEREAQRIAESEGRIELRIARKYLADQLGPRHYLFSFNSSLPVEAVTEVLITHVISRREYTLNHFRLPRVSVIGDVVAWLIDDRTTIDLDTDIMAVLEDGGLEAVPVFSSWRHPNRFGLLIYSLMRVVMERLKPIHGEHGVAYGALSHFPAGLYLEEAQQQADHVFFGVNRASGVAERVHVLRARS